MLKFLKKEKKMENYDQATLVERLVSEQEDINQVDLSKKHVRAAMFEAIGKRPHLVAKINGENAKELLSEIIKEQPKYFLYLESEQYFDEIAQYYLLYRLNSTDNKTVVNSDLNVQQSLAGRIVVTYSHTTGDDEKINYYDNELNIPLSLKSSFKIDLKLVDALKFIIKLDTHISMLGKNKITATITDVISNTYKSFLINYIKENSAGFYKLNSSLNEVEEKFKEEIADLFAEYGFEVRDFVLKKIAIPEAIQHKIEDQAFEIRKRREEMEADAENAKKSLESYEYKIALQEKYPNADHCLTEYEKDLALKRYLIKMGRLKEEELDHSIQIKHVKENVDRTIQTKDDEAPVQEVKKFDWKKLLKFVPWALIAIGVINLLSENPGGIIFAVAGVAWIVVATKMKAKKAKANNEVVKK